MTREEAIDMAKADLKCMKRDTSGKDEMCNSHKCDECSLNYERGNVGEREKWLCMAIKALQAWDKFKQALDKRILEQGFDEDEWSISYNELIKLMKKCGVVE